MAREATHEAVQRLPVDLGSINRILDHIREGIRQEAEQGICHDTLLLAWLLGEKEADIIQRSRTKYRMEKIMDIEGYSW